MISAIFWFFSLVMLLGAFLCARVARSFFRDHRAYRSVGWHDGAGLMLAQACLAVFMSLGFLLLAAMFTPWGRLRWSAAHRVSTPHFAASAAQIHP